MRITRWLPLTMLVAVAACDGEGTTRPPATEVRVFDAAPNAATIIVRREEDRIVADGGAASTLSFGRGELKSWDSDTYDINLDYITPAGPVRAQTTTMTLSPQIDYTFVAVSPNSEPELLIFTTDERPATATTPRVTVMHAFPGLGDLDVYMAEPGMLPLAMSPRGTISYAADPLTFEIPPDTYQIYLTTAGDPNDIVFESTPTQVIPERTNNQADQAEFAYVVADPAGQGTAAIALFSAPIDVAVNGSIAQVGLQSALRTVHGINDRLERDIYVDDTLSPPLFPAQAFGVVSDYGEVTFGPRDLILTPVGNPGTEEISANHIAFPGVSYMFFTGNTFDGEIDSRIIAEDNRSIIGQATVSVLNGAGLFEALEIYIELPGTDISTQLRPVALAPLGSTPRSPLRPGDYEITIANPFTDTIVAGPLPITLEDGGVYGVLLVNGVGGSTVDIVLYDDFVP